MASDDELAAGANTVVTLQRDDGSTFEMRLAIEQIAELESLGLTIAAPGISAAVHAWRERQ